MLSVFLPPFPPIWRQCLSLNMEFDVLATLAACPRHLPPVLTSTTLPVLCLPMYAVPCLYMGAGYQNPAPHACLPDSFHLNRYPNTNGNFKTKQ